MNIGLAIKLVRKKFSISQLDLAKQCGIGQSALSMIELGKTQPSKKTLSKICEVLGVPVLVLYILSMQDTYISPSKKEVYELVYPSLKALALQMVNEIHLDLFNRQEAA
jgi:transcriptional regulator with XRE-family HTH domain